MLCTHTHNGILFSLKKERNPAICDNMDKLGGHYAKWNKPDTERQILHNRTYMESKKVELIYRMKCYLLVARGWGNGENMVKGNKLSVKRWISSGDLMYRMLTIFNINN